MAQNELPGSVITQLQTIKAGSLIIAMDTSLQALPGYFNLKAYGLVNALLQNEIPVKWAIKKGKTKPIIVGAPKDSIDFKTAANGIRRVFPDTVNIAAATSLYCGPFIIDSSWVSLAVPIIKSFGNNVAVHQMLLPAVIDIRYTLTFKPLVGLLNGIAGSGADTIMRYQLQEAGFYSWSYKLITPANSIFNQSSVYSLLADTHISTRDTAHGNPVKRYIQTGSNLFVQCAAVGGYDSTGNFLTTLGLDSAISSKAYVHTNYDLPIAQFQGTMSNPWGEYQAFKLKSGSAARAYEYDVLSKSIVGGVKPLLLSGAKILPAAQKGGNVYYLAGHDFYYVSSGITPNQNFKINGRRIFMNAIFVPPSDTIGLDFRTDIKLDITACPGFPVKNESFCIQLVVSNDGYRAKNVNVLAALPVGLTYSSHTVTKGTYNSGLGIWSIDSVMKGESATLILTVNVNQLGNISFAGLVSSISVENVTINNADTINLFAVSRPVALSDTDIFVGPYYLYTNTRINDSDEDGGPFGNTIILTPPTNGTADVPDSDTIRYAPNPSYVGPDSLQYLTCDGYNLCDTGWLFINVSVPLPVDLTEFSGSRAREMLSLRWTTLSEKGNEYFNVEKSIDGKVFSVQGKVIGAGTSSMIHNYAFKQVDTGEPLIYFRLKQVDYNGAFKLSRVIALPLKSNGILSLNLYPNPVNSNNELNIHMNGLPEGYSTLKITDITGRPIFEKVIESQKESTTDEFFNTAGYLEAGCYIISLITDSEVVGVKLIVK